MGEADARGQYGKPNHTQDVTGVSKPAPSVGLREAGASGQGSGVGPNPQGLWVSPNPQPGVSLSCNTGTKCTLLPTATVDVMTVTGPVKAQLIFDTGSDRSYVSERLRKKVGGQWKGSVEMTYAAFGVADRVVFVVFMSLNLQVPTSLPVVQRIELVEVPVLCAPLMRPSVEAHLQSFHHVEMADNISSETPLQIDILIGQDTYWSLVRTGLIRSPEGLVAQETVFGWVLSGLAEGAHGSTGPTCQLLTVTDVPGVVKSLWSLEGFGIDDSPCDESSVLSKFQNLKKAIESS